MELINLSRYLDIKNPTILPFEKIRRLDPVMMSQDLKIIQDQKNLEILSKYVQEGLTVVPIRRLTQINNYMSRTSFPRRVLAEMTSNCNFRCRMCPQRNLHRERMNMDKSLYCKIIDELDYYGIEGLWIYHLGESLLHPDFEDILKHIRSKKNLGVIWMSTNGELLSEDKIHLVLSSNIDYINFSAHAITEETYKTVTDNNLFKKVQNNLNLLYEIKDSIKSNELTLPKKPFLHVQMIEQETTKHEVDGFIRKHYNKADIVSINMLEYVNLPNNHFGYVQRERKPLQKCTRVTRNDCFICSNGQVTLCDAAYNGELCCGNIKDNTLYEIWNGEIRSNILKLNNEGRMSELEFCRSCTDYDI